MLNITKQITPIWFLVILLLSTSLFFGCSGTKTVEPKTTETPQIGIIDMDRAIKSHPKYQEWQKLKQQAAGLRQQLTMEAEQAAREPSEIPPGINLEDSATAGLQTAAQQEFNAKMAAKQRELQAAFEQKFRKNHEELSEKLNTYAQELEEEYQPRIFNYQLKLQTIRLDEKQVAEFKKAMDDLKTEQANKLAAKEEELSRTLDALMDPEKETIEQELAGYAGRLHAELQNQTAAQTAVISAQIAQGATTPSPIGTNAQIEQQLGMKEQEINVLEEYMVNDIRDKAGKVAAERRLDTVLSGYQVNISAIDITNAVIAAFNK